MVFDSTNAVLWAEEVAEDAGVAVEVVPAPAASEAKCTVALLTATSSVPDLTGALEEAGVPFRVWSVS